MAEMIPKAGNPAERFSVVTFDSTTDALIFERQAQAAGLCGRLIPTPRSYSAHCGLAWREPASGQDKLLTLLAGTLRYSAYYEQTETG